jgi:hypothetical protein
LVNQLLCLLAESIEAVAKEWLNRIQESDCRLLAERGREGNRVRQGVMNKSMRYRPQPWWNILKMGSCRLQRLAQQAEEFGLRDSLGDEPSSECRCVGEGPFGTPLP